MKKVISVFLICVSLLTILCTINPVTASAAAAYSTGEYVISERAGVNLRAGAGTSYKKLTAVPYNKVVKVTSVSGSWGKVTYNNKTGWVSLLYATKTASAATSAYSTGSYLISERAGVNLRAGAGTDYKKLTAVPYNKVVKVTSVSGSWGKVTYNGKTGWIALQYTTKQTTNKAVNVTTPSKDLANIPSANYKVTATYTINSTKYQCCSVTKAWGNIAKGTEFYLKASNKSLVTNQSTLRKLGTIQVVNSVRCTCISWLNSMKVATNSVYSVACQWTRNTQLTKFIGVSGGASLRAIASATTGQPVGVFDSVVTLCKEAVEPETSLAVTTILCLKATSNDAIYWCNYAETLLSKNITDYDRAVSAVKAISLAYGNYEAAMFLGRPIVEDAAAANPWTSTFKNMGCSILEGCGFKAADALSKFENIVYLGDALSQYKVTEKYNTARNRVLNALILG